MPGAILVAVNDSPAGFAAADAAIGYAKRLGVALFAVTVLEPVAPALAVGVEDEDATTLTQRRTREAEAILRHVTDQAALAGVVVHTHLRNGAPSAEILAEAGEIGAEIVVIALVDRPSHAMPYIGSQTLHVLEFATVPVLVVPPQEKPSA